MVSVSDRGRAIGGTTAQRRPNFSPGSAKKKRGFMIILIHKKKITGAKFFLGDIFRDFIKSSDHFFGFFHFFQNTNNLQRNFFMVGKFRKFVKCEI